MLVLMRDREVTIFKHMINQFPWRLEAEFILLSDFNTFLQFVDVVTRLKFVKHLLNINQAC